MTAREAIKYLKDPIGKREQHDEAISMAIEALRNSPTQMSGTSDLISRQMAVDAICKEWCNCTHDDCENKNMMEAGFDPCDGCSDVDAIMDLPSVQPEIIHCRDCIHYRYADNSIPQEHRHTCNLDGDRWKPDDYCSFAERKMRHDQGKSD